MKTVAQMLKQWPGKHVIGVRMFDGSNVLEVETWLAPEDVKTVRDLVLKQMTLGAKKDRT